MDDVEEGVYNIDTGHKMGLATGVERSPLKYSIVRSNAPRFQESNPSDLVPFGVYNTDISGMQNTAKKSIETVARDNRRFYASAFQSKVPRFTRPWTSPTTDVMYDVERLKNAAPATIHKSLDVSPQKYAILRSKYKRFQDRGLGEGPDVTYDIDRGNKEGLYTHMLHSSISYAPMRTPAHKSAADRHIEKTRHLGPGTYDYSLARDVEVSPYMNNRPLSSLISGAARFGGRKGSGGFGLTSTWTPERDEKAWHQRGRTISKAEYLRPMYLPKSYMHQGENNSNKQAGK